MFFIYLYILKKILKRIHESELFFGKCRISISVLASILIRIRVTSCECSFYVLVLKNLLVQLSEKMYPCFLTAIWYAYARVFGESHVMCIMHAIDVTCYSFAAIVNSKELGEMDMQENTTPAHHGKTKKKESAKEKRESKEEDIICFGFY